MAATKRSQNKCNDCRYTWFPRGKYLSRECPNCKSSNVSIVGPGLGSILVGLFAFGIAIVFFGGNKKSEEGSPPVSPTVEQRASPIVIDSSNSNLQAPTNVAAPVETIPAVENRTQGPSETQRGAVEPLADNERIVTQEELNQMKAFAVEQARAQLNACAANDGSPETSESCVKAVCTQLENAQTEQCLDQNQPSLINGR